MPTPCDHFTYAGLSAIGIAGVNDPNGNALYGTETRQEVAGIVPFGGCLQAVNSGGTCNGGTNQICNVFGGCPAIWVGKGRWEDAACGGPAQVDIVPSSLGPAYNEPIVGYDPGFTPGAGNCTGFQVTNSIAHGIFSYDNTGAPLSPPVDIVAAGGPAGGQVFIRNHLTGGWPSPSVGASAAGGASLIRAMSAYDDNSNGTHRSYLIIGPNGPSRNGNPHSLTFKGWGAGGCVGAACWIDGVDEAYVPNHGGSTCVTGEEGFTACTNLQAQFPAGTVLPSLNLRFMGIVQCPVSNFGVTPVVNALFASVSARSFQTQR